MPTDDRKPSRNEVERAVLEELEGRRLFSEHYEVYVPNVEVRHGLGMATARGGFSSGSTVVSLRVVVSWRPGSLAVDQVNDLQDHLEDHRVGADGQAELELEECRITIDGEYTWDTWTREW